MGETERGVAIEGVTGFRISVEVQEQAYGVRALLVHSYEQRRHLAVVEGGAGDDAIRLRAMLEEEAKQAVVREHQGGIQQAGICSVGTAGGEQRDELEVVLVCGPREGRSTVACDGVDVGTRIEKGLDAGDALGARGIMQGGPADVMMRSGLHPADEGNELGKIVGGNARIGAASRDQPTDFDGVAPVGCHHQRGHTVLIAGIEDAAVELPCEEKHKQQENEADLPLPQ